MTVNERLFEDAIERSLLTNGGYLKSSPSHFDAVLGLDTAELFAFIGATQAKEWESLLGRYGNDPDAAQRGFAKRLASELDTAAQWTFFATVSSTWASRSGSLTSSPPTA